MIHYLFCLVLTFVGVISFTPVFAQDPTPSANRELGTTISVGDVTYRMPFVFPSGEEILQALPAKVRLKNARIQCELLEYRLEAPRTYPKVGQARLAKAHFKCTVVTDEAIQVVTIDRNALIAEKKPH